MFMKIIPYAVRALIVVVIVTIGLAAFQILVMTQPEMARRDVSDTRFTVESMELKAIPIHREWEGFGTGQPQDYSEVSAELTALVAGIPNEIMSGASVTKGQLLVLLDADDFIDQVTQMKQDLERLASQLETLSIQEARLEEQLKLSEQETALAAKELERAIESRSRQGTTDTEVDRKTAELNRSKRAETALRSGYEQVAPKRLELQSQVRGQIARLELAKRNVARCSILSPLDGVLQRVDVEIGERVSPGMPIARVVSLNRIEIPLQFPIGARNGIHVGDSILLNSEGSLDACWSSTVSRLAPEGNANSRTVTVYAEVTQTPQSTTMFVPGQFVQARLRSSSAHLRYVVPRRAVLDGQIWIVGADKTAVPVPVEVDYHVQDSFDHMGVVDTEWAVLAEGSQFVAGWRVIITGVVDLHSGMALCDPAIDPEYTTQNKQDK